LTYLVDTNVVSELRKGGRCDPGVASWFAKVSSEEIYLSVLTIGEIRKGIESIRRRDERTAEVLEAWLGELVAAYSNRILSVDEGIAEQWGRYNVPDPLPVLDSLLAATASMHGLTLVTRNVKDVERTGVNCLNPFGDGFGRRGRTVDPIPGETV
jgi:predicted nucleic acid-binding protein